MKFLASIRRGVHNRDPLQDPDLRCRKSDAVRCVHRLRHVSEQLSELLIEDGYFLRWFFERRIGNDTNR